MSLNWDLTKAEKYNALSDEEKDILWQETQGIIFTTMGIGIGELTEDNLAEFYARQKFSARMNNFEPFTLEQVRRYVGLKTNVSYETYASWQKRIAKYNYDEILRSAKREIEASK